MRVNLRVLAVILVVSISTIHFMYFSYSPTNADLHIVPHGLVTLFFIMMLSFICGTILLREIGPKRMVVRDKGMPFAKILKILPEQGKLVFFWERWWMKRDNGSIVSYAAIENTIQMRLAPITDNPKVRHLSYDVQVTTPKTPDGLIGMWFALKGDDIHSYFRRELFEFGEKHSRELGSFYNPLNAKQQARFSALVMPTVSSLATRASMAVTNISFSVN